MKKVLGFQEFNPRSYSAGIDWRTIITRWVCIASIVVIPCTLALIQFLYKVAPLVVYMMAGVASLYVPALLLVRRPTVTVSKDFQITVSRPRSVDTRILKQAAGSAFAYFALLTFSILMLGRW